MWDWTIYVLTGVGGTIAVCQIVAAVWCVIELYRQWRNTREFWSSDWLSLVHDLEVEFGVTLTAADFASLSPEARWAKTRRQVWEVVTSRAREAGREVPAEEWERFVAFLSTSFHVKLEQIKPDSQLYADLGMEYGFGG